MGQLAKLGYHITFNYSWCIMQDPRIENELKTTPRVGRMFPLDNLHLPPIALVSVDAAARGVHQTVKIAQTAKTAPKLSAK